MSKEFVLKQLAKLKIAINELSDDELVHLYKEAVLRLENRKRELADRYVDIYEKSPDIINGKLKSDN